MKPKLQHFYELFIFFIAAFLPTLPMQQQGAASSTVLAKAKRAIYAEKTKLTRQLVYPFLTPDYTIDANADEEQRYPTVLTPERKNHIADLAQLYATGFSIIPATCIGIFIMKKIGTTIAGKEAVSSVFKKNYNGFYFFLGALTASCFGIPLISFGLRPPRNTYPLYPIPICLIASTHGAIITLKLLQEHYKK